MNRRMKSLLLLHLLSVGLQFQLAISSAAFFNWGIQAHHLTPNSILHIAIFVHLCVAFLGIEHHFNLFQHLFHLKPQPSANEITEFVYRVSLFFLSFFVSAQNKQSKGLRLTGMMMGQVLMYPLPQWSCQVVPKPPNRNRAHHRVVKL